MVRIQRENPDQRFCQGIVGCWLVALLSAVICMADPATSGPADPFEVRLGSAPPLVGPVDQTFLIRFARRVMLRQLLKGEQEEIVYVPSTLEGLICRVSVTLRRDGGLMGTADSPLLPVMEACRAAAEKALAAAQKDNKVTRDTFLDCNLEVELVGPREQVGDGRDSPQMLVMKFEPAIHGLAVRVDGEEILVRPSQLISQEPLCNEDGEMEHQCNRYEVAMAGLINKLGIRKDPPDRPPASVTFWRFRTTHLYEPEPDGPAVELQGGMRWVPVERLTRAHLLEAADDVARYIRYRQVSDGTFSYEYLPGKSMYWPTGQNWVRQVATSWALALYARQKRDHASAEAVDRSIHAFSNMVKPLRDHSGAAYVATPEGQHPLGTTAMFVLALIDCPDRERYEQLRLSLLEGLAAMQQEDGSFRTHFPPSTSVSSQNYYPGEALLAIAKHYALTRDSKWRAICDKALPFYVRYFRETSEPSFVPWHVRAWGELARTTHLQRYAGFVYEMSDFLAASQMSDLPRSLEIYEGAFDVYGRGRGGVSTAVYTEGFADAVLTAQAMGDRERADRYRAVARHAVRFTEQLRFRSDEAYYVRSPEDVIGGVRNTPINPTLRIDHCQHALSAFLAVADLLSQP